MSALNGALRVACLMVGLVSVAGTQAAEPGCCNHCGCQSNCRKVCRLVCETKMVPKVTYTCECEDFCVPGPSQKCSVPCNCGNCCDGSCGNHCKTAWVPTCAEVRTRKKPVRHETMVEVKSYKWVVEYVCGDCSCRQDQASNLAPVVSDSSVRAGSATSFITTLFGE